MADGVVARLKILLGIDSAEVATGSRKAEREVSKMSKGISGAAKLATAALGALGATLTVDTIIRVTKQALAFTTAIKDQAKIAGVSTRALQEYRYAALQAGVSNEDLADGFKELTQKIGEAASGSKSAAAIFNDAGISIRGASGEVRNAADILPELADAYNRLTSDAEKSAFAARIFGEDAGPKMKSLLEQGSAGMNSYREAAHELGMVISDVNIKKADEAEKKMAALNRVLSVKIATFVAENSEEIIKLTDELLKFASAAIQAAAAWAKFAGRSDARPGGAAARDENARIRSENRGVGEGVRRSTAGRGVWLPGSVGDARVNGRWTRGFRPGLPKSGRGGGRRPQDDPSRVNAIGGSVFDGFDWSRMTPASGASDWMKVSAASEVLKENSAAVDVLMKRIALEYSSDLARNAEAAARGMGDQAEAARRVMNRLFPDKARTREYYEELLMLRKGREAGTISADELAEAESRLRAEWERDVPSIAKMNEALARYVNTSKDASIKSEAANEVIAESFERSADRALYAIDRLAGAVRGGGFLDILSSVLGLGLQLAPLFGGGGSMSAKIGNAGGVKGASKVPGLATGGAMILGGRSGIDRNLLSLNGAPLARVSAGERMTISPANDRAAGAGGGIVVVKVEEGALFRPVVASTAGRVVAEASPAIMDGSARVTASRAARRQTRRL